MGERDFNLEYLEEILIAAKSLSIAVVKNTCVEPLIEITLPKRTYEFIRDYLCYKYPSHQMLSGDDYYNSDSISYMGYVHFVRDKR